VIVSISSISGSRRISTSAEGAQWVSLDLYNVANANPVLTYNNSFTPGGPWLQANSFSPDDSRRVSAEWTF
jgi:hypothetical protein